MWMWAAALAGVPEPIPREDPTAVPHLFYRGFVAGALNPSGAQVDVAGEVRIPVLRFGGLMSNTTFLALFFISPSAFSARNRRFLAMGDSCDF